MSSAVDALTSQRELADVVRRIRVRWRLKLGLQGLAVESGAAVAGLLIGPWLMACFDFSPIAVVMVRLAYYGGVIVLVARYLALPLRRRVSDEQVALYLEEHEPSLNAVVVSAVDGVGRRVPAAARSPYF